MRKKYTEYDDGEGTRIDIDHDGAIEISRYDELTYEVQEDESVILTKQESMDVATSVVSRNIPNRLEGGKFCEDCCFHRPEDKCSKLLERPLNLREMVFHEADCKKVNPIFTCGYHHPRELAHELL